MSPKFKGHTLDIIQGLYTGKLIRAFFTQTTRIPYGTIKMRGKRSLRYNMFGAYFFRIHTENIINCGML